MSNRSRHFRDRPNRIMTIDDERKQALFLEEFNLVPPDVDILDAPYKCYKINVEWAKIVLGMVSQLTRIAVWRDPPYEDNNRGILQILKFLSQDTDCMSFELRQSPTDECLLEQSIDGGATWTPAFDYSLCMPPVDLTSITEILAEMAESDNQYDGSTGSNAPNWDYGVTPERDATLELYLCRLLATWFRNMIYAEKRRRQSISGFVGDLAAVNTIVFGVLGTFIAGWGFLVASAIGATVAGIAEIFGSVSDALLNDDEAINNVICHWRDQILANGLNEVSWRTAFQGHPFAPLSNEDQIIGIYAPYVENDASFANFITGLETALTGKYDNVLQPCPCDFVWEHTFNFVANNTAQGWVTLPNPNSQLYVDGWGGGTWAGAGVCLSKPAWNVDIELAFVARPITDIEVHFEQIVPATRDDLRVIDNDGTLYSSGNGGGALPVLVLPVGKTISYLRVNYLEETSCDVVEAGNPVEARIQKIIIRGEGANPFV